MSDVLTKDQRHCNMAAIRSSNTKPELVLRRSLWRLGFRYHINDRRLPGTPDISLPKYKTVVFVHGCFWHGHKGCKYYTVPRTNTEFWVAKVARNQERDQEVWRRLEAKGWSVVIVWECELKGGHFHDTLERVESEILQNGESYRKAQEERHKERELHNQERRNKVLREVALDAELKAIFHTE